MSKKSSLFTRIISTSIGIISSGLVLAYIRIVIELRAVSDSSTPVGLLSFAFLFFLFSIFIWIPFWYRLGK